MYSSCMPIWKQHWLNTNACTLSPNHWFLSDKQWLSPSLFFVMSSGFLTRQRSDWEFCLKSMCSRNSLIKINRCTDGFVLNVHFLFLKKINVLHPFSSLFTALTFISVLGIFTNYTITVEFNLFLSLIRSHDIPLLSWLLVTVVICKGQSSCRALS